MTSSDNSKDVIKDANDTNNGTDKKKLLSNWWDQTTELYSQLIENGDLERENLQTFIQNFATEKKNDICNDIHGISNDIINNVFEQVFGLPVHNPGKLSDVLPVLVGPLKNPTERQYMNCLEHGGDIVWDTKGQFNCLFPEAYLRARNLQNLQLSKEQVSNDKDHKKFGLFFTDYTKYLTWKYDMTKKNSQKAGADEIFPSDSTTSNEEYQYFSSYTKQYVDSDGHVQKQKLVEKKTQTPEGMKVFIERTTYPEDGGEPSTEVEEKLIPKKWTQRVGILYIETVD